MARFQFRKEGKVKKLVDCVEQISFSGPRSVAQGQNITYVTERCVMRLEREGVTVIEIAPGIDLERDILRPSGISAAHRERLPQNGPVAVPGRSPSICNFDQRGKRSSEPLRRFELRWTLCAPDTEPPRQAQCARSPNDRCAP